MSDWNNHWDFLFTPIHSLYFALKEIPKERGERVNVLPWSGRKIPGYMLVVGKEGQAGVTKRNRTLGPHEGQELRIDHLN